MKPCLYLLLIANCFHVNAESIKEGFFIGAAAEGALTDLPDGQSSKAFGFETSIGYNFNPYISTSISYGYDIDLFSTEQKSDFERVDGFVTGRLPLSKFAGLNFGVGAVYSQHDYSPAAQFFIDYKLTDATFINAGYKLYVEPADKQENVTAFQVGLRYLFNQKSKTKAVVAAPKPKVKQETIKPVIKYTPIEPVLFNLFFDFDSIQVNSKNELHQAISNINNLIENALDNGVTPAIEISGFTDTTGPSIYNSKLSTSRAHTVSQRLLEAGINSKFIKVVSGKGELQSTSDALSRKVQVLYQEK